MKRLAVGLLAVVLAIFAVSGTALAQSAPEFKLGFATLASMIPDVAGQPLENEHYGANGDSLQQTTTGLMVWRKADNWTAFTNGYMTWINGPYGLQSRLNTDRFDWEKDQQKPVAAPTSGSGTLGITVHCPVAQEFCSKGQVINNGNFSGIEFALPEGTPITAAFDGRVDDQPKIPDRPLSEPFLYLRGINGIEVNYSYYGTASVKPGTEVKAGDEIGKIGPGTFPVAPLIGFNLLFSYRDVHGYQPISPQDFQP